MKTTLLLSLSLSVAAACGKSGSKPAAPPVTFDEAGVNALVPAELKDKLAFAKQDIIEERGRSKTTYTVVAPKGWEPGFKGFASLKPKEDLGFMTKFDVGTNCDGTCQPKDWAKAADKVMFSQFKGDKIIKDDVTKTSRLMIAEKGDSTYVVYAWWTDGATHYNSCMASLEAPVRAAAPAFAKACQAVAITGGD